MSSHRSLRRAAIAALAALATAVATAALVGPARAASTGAQATYLVLYRSGASTAGATKAVSDAGGSMVASYSQIGVVVARSKRSDFGSRLGQANGVQAV